MQFQHETSGSEDGSMTPRYDDYPDSYATHYGALSDVAAADDNGDVGTPPDSGGSYPSYDAKSSSLGSSIRFESQVNGSMASYASSILSPRNVDDDPVHNLQRSSNPDSHHFFGASTYSASTDHHQQQQHQPRQSETSDEISTPKSPESDEHDNGNGSRDVVSNDHASSPQQQPNQQYHAHHPYPTQQTHPSVPFSPGSRHSQHSKLSALSKNHGTYVSQKTISRESARELAKTALSARATSVGDVTFENPRESNLRESIRRVQVCGC